MGEKRVEITITLFKEDAEPKVEIKDFLGILETKDMSRMRKYLGKAWRNYMYTKRAEIELERKKKARDEEDKIEAGVLISEEN